MTTQQILFNLPVTAARCQSLSSTDNQRCSNNAATYMRVGCVHEHVFVVLSCEPCAREAQRRNSYCGTCWDGKAGPPHFCALLGMPIEPEDVQPVPARTPGDAEGPQEARNPADSPSGELPGPLPPPTGDDTAQGTPGDAEEATDG